MGPIFMNPFKKHDVSEFENVYVPLAEAQRHKSVVAQHNDMKNGTVIEEDGMVKKNPAVNPDEKDIEAGTSPDIINPYSAYTIDGLRTEIDADIAASGHDSVYDRM